MLIFAEVDADEDNDSVMLLCALIRGLHRAGGSACSNGGMLLHPHCEGIGITWPKPQLSGR